MCLWLLLRLRKEPQVFLGACRNFWGVQKSAGAVNRWVFRILLRITSKAVREEGLTSKALRGEIEQVSKACC